MTIHFTDKGNATVVMDAATQHKKMKESLKDPAYIQKVEGRPGTCN